MPDRLKARKKQPPVSVVIPVYNGEGPLKKCLASLRRQDYPWSKLEIVMVDDDSSDGSAAVARSFGAKVVRNGARHIERGKALGIRATRHEFILFLDADNYLTTDSWLSQAVEALQGDPEVVGVESARFEYLRSDPAANRYCALFGINDPMAYYLDRRDRLADWESRWVLPGRVVKETAEAWILAFTPEAAPTLGSQGYLTRRSLLRKADHWPTYFHMDANLQLIRMGHCRFALLKQPVGHDHCATAAGFVKKCRRNADLFFKYRHLRKYTWDTPPLTLCWTAFSMVTLVRPLADALRGFLRRPDPAWFLHPVFSAAIPVIYAWKTVRFRLSGGA
jgi:glycosyltransferase involved in cell wall biosynthesis